ncbi:MAG TPA: hypothetical protein VNK95_00325, partial [Caldilineaceae bacterium]|nr:hypothetical protein [Caldilineaceae bacterium]
ATPQPSEAKTLILVNRARVETLYGAPAAASLMEKLFALAADPAVLGLVLQVETDPAVAAAYAAWTASLADNDKANDVVAAIRNRVLTVAASAPQLAYVVIIGDDRIIPFRRVPDRISPTGPSADSVEPAYAPEVVEDGTIRAALAANMILTDDYLVDKEPSHWEDRQDNQYELYLPDYAVSRLVEQPAHIIAFIDSFLGGNKTINTSRVLVTGYDFLNDSANIITTLYTNDALATDSELNTPNWPGDALRAKYLNANPRFDIYSVNGHSTHLAQGTPDEDDITAAEVLAATTNLSGTLVYSVGCHSGLNEPGALDLAEAYIRRLANYMGNTGFGWGGSGVVYSEALMRNVSRELLRETSAQIGPALAAAKKRYFMQAQTFNAFDAKVLMQVVHYGLPMVSVTSGGALTDSPSFPSADPIFTPPSSFGPIAQGSAGYNLPGSFGAFGQSTTSQGVTYNLDGNITFAAGEPVQPVYWANVDAPAVGDLRGAVFLGGIYSDVVSFDPVIALADNEYVTEESEPAFTSEVFFPDDFFTVRAGVPGASDMILMSLGQYRSHPTAQAAGEGEAREQGINRIFSQMSFSTYYSNSPDRNAASISFIDGVLITPPNVTPGQGQIKVETTDDTGIHRVVVAYHEQQGQWQSQDLTFDAAAQKWTGVITGTTNTEFFIQVVDEAGNVAVNNNKGRFYPLAAPLPLAQGAQIVGPLYLPLIQR